jgi:hypothetical protein
MKKSWIVAGLGIVVVVTVGVFVLTTKNANDTKNVDKKTTESTEYTEKVITQGKLNPSVPSSAAGGEKEWLAGFAEENLSAPVLALLGLDGKLHNYNSMLSAIALLPKGNIAADDVAALRDMLTWPNDQFPEGMRDIEINAVKNDVLDRLLRQKELPEAMGYQLVGMFADTESDPVWRDYCVQFMSPYYERAASELHLTTEGTEAQRGLVSNTSVSSSEAGGENMAELDAVRETMIHALDERNETIAGTALIGVELLSRTHGEFDRDMILDKASEIAANEAFSNESRLTALRLSASENLKPETGNVNEQVADTGRRGHVLTFNIDDAKKRGRAA